jgi:Spy/CpxP family protein refolding chaperone
MKNVAALVLICGSSLILAPPILAVGSRNYTAPAYSSRSAVKSMPPLALHTFQAGKPSASDDADTPENDDSLKLTDDQKDKIKSIRKDAKDKVRDVQKDTSLNDDIKERKLKQIKKETRAQVWAVMTPEQQRQWAAELRERREAKKSGGKSPD